MKEIAQMCFKDENGDRYTVLPLDGEYFIRSLWTETVDGKIVSPPSNLTPEEMIRAVQGRTITIEDKLHNRSETPRIVDAWPTAEIERPHQS